MPTTYEIAADGAVATVAAEGATLRTLQVEGRNLVVPSDGTEPADLYRGIVAAPWPNRIGDGRYEIGGRTHAVPINEPDRNTALHGLVLTAHWQPVERAGHRIVLQHRLDGVAGYPFCLELEATYEIQDRALLVRLTAVNRSDEAAPYGCTIHPYLSAGTGRVDDWTLELPAAAYLEPDDRGLPRQICDVAGTPYDFRRARRLGRTAVDHAFTRLTGTVARLRDADGAGVEMAWDHASPWVQVYTSDRPGTPHHRTGVAVEPMTCPPDAFRTGTDLVVLAPGDKHVASWALRPVSC